MPQTKWPEQPKQKGRMTLDTNNCPSAFSSGNTRMNKIIITEKEFFHNKRKSGHINFFYLK